MAAQVDELVAGRESTRTAGSELARAVQLERDRTRSQFLRVVAGEARQLGEELCAGLASAAATAGVAKERREAELQNA